MLLRCLKKRRRRRRMRKKRAQCAPVRDPPAVRRAHHARAVSGVHRTPTRVAGSKCVSPAWRRARPDKLQLGLRAGGALHPCDGDEGRGEVGLHSRPRRVGAGRRRPRRVVDRQRRHAELREAPHRAPQPPPEPEPAARRCARAGAAAAEPDDVDLPAPVAGQAERVRRGGAARPDDDARRLTHSCARLWL
ncbi:hypothetical protein C2845_PM16G08870 [Panicum miliaceum]|uniref:Uncharacterized protein n=1 Tax=Panicum miliaceum TaxID=4540 RepID=A0A3L6PYB0_PANMI|nr:hypothetical protein C2845_PM16G08870 [Panicum miliaceum]